MKFYEKGILFPLFLVILLTYVLDFFFSSVVDKIRVMLGSFSPQQEPYTYVMDEETTPAGILARGVYTAKTKVVLAYTSFMISARNIHVTYRVSQMFFSLHI